MWKKLVILFATIGVCMLIGANYLSHNVAPATAATEESSGTESADADVHPTLNIEALKKAAMENPIKPSVPEGAVDVAPIVYGNPDAPVIIEEFASFTCSHCASFHRDMLPTLKKALIDTGLAKLHIYSFVRSAVDLEATMIVQCQGTNEARKKFAGAILNGQEQWAHSTNYQEGLKTIARVGGMSEEAYELCIKDEELIKKIAESRQWFDAQVKVEATPYFRVGDQVVKGSRDVKLFEEAITKAVNGTNAMDADKTAE